jgi:hypothetical protein
MVEESVEDNGSASSEDGNTGVHPKDLRVDENGNESLVKSGAESVGEEIDTLHERLHRWRGFGVSVLETGDGDEDLGHADEDVRGRLDGDVDVVGQRRIPIHASGAGAWRVVAGSGGVNEVLHDSGVDHAEGSEAESDRDTHDGTQLDASAAEDGVDDAVEQGGEDQDGDRVEVLHEIVGHAVALHLSGLGNEVGRELSVAHPEDGICYCQRRDRGMPMVYEDDDLQKTKTLQAFSARWSSSMKWSFHGTGLVLPFAARQLGFGAFVLRALIIMPIALNASVIIWPWGGRTTYDLRLRIRTRIPRLNMTKHMMNAVQKPLAFSMKGVAIRDKDPRLIHQ